MRNVKVRSESASGLEPQTLALVRIATATATGNEAALRERMIAARSARVPAAWVEELLLQSFLNVGYPLALVAFGVWREVAGPPEETGERVAHPEWERWTELRPKRPRRSHQRSEFSLLPDCRRQFLKSCRSRQQTY